MALLLGQYLKPGLRSKDLFGIQVSPRDVGGFLIPQLQVYSLDT